MTATETYTCPYCRQQSSGSDATCAHCGAPVDIRLRTTASGWTELPAIPDMARIQFGQSSCQIEGQLAPVADVKLASGDTVYFAHHVVLWQEPSVEVSALPLSRAWNRLRAGLPLVMLQAAGPGRIAFSHDRSGEMLAVPLQPGSSVDVREDHLVFATGSVAYDWFDTGVWFVTGGSGGGGESAGMKLLKAGLEMAVEGDDRGSDSGETEWHYPVGRYLDRFTAGAGPGLVMVGAGGNAFMRTLAEGETLLVKPPSLLYKDSSVSMQLHVEYPDAGFKFWRSWGNRYLWLRLWGPGRVALESSYERLEDPGRDFRQMSPATDYHWYG